MVSLCGAEEGTNSTHHNLNRDDLNIQLTPDACQLYVYRIGISYRLY